MAYFLSVGLIDKQPSSNRSELFNASLKEACLRNKELHLFQCSTGIGNWDI